MWYYGTLMSVMLVIYSRLEPIMQAFCCLPDGTAKCASVQADPVSAWLRVELLYKTAQISALLTITMHCVMSC